MRNYKIRNIIFLLLCLSVITYGQNRWRLFNHNNSAIINFTYRSITVDKYNNVWAGGDPDLLMFNGNTWQNMSNRFPNTADYFSVLAKDTNNIWIGSASTYHYDGQNYSVMLAGDAGYYFADDDSVIWISCSGYGVGLYKYDGNNLTHYSSSQIPFTYNSFTGITLDKNNVLWGGYKDLAFVNKLFSFDGSNWKTYPLDYSPFPFHKTVLVDSENNLWIGTTKGKLVKFDGNTWEVYDTPLPSAEVISAIAIDKNHKIWLATSAGLMSFDGQNWKVYSFDNSSLPAVWVFDVAVDSNNNKWLALIGDRNYIGGIAEFNENGIVTGVENNSNEIPVSYLLSQNYPNPFNPSTVIKYRIPKESFVTLKVYDVLGKEVKTLVNEEKTAGNYNISFNASSLSSGIYFYSITAGNYTTIKKMVLLK